MAISRRTLAPWWPAAWLVTSAVLVGVLVRIESGWFLAVFYLGLNACTLLYAALDESAARARRMPILGWCVALQLPAMLWLFLNARRAPERLLAQKSADDTERASTPLRR